MYLDIEKTTRRSWEDVVTVDDAVRIIEENGIKSRKELFLRYEGLYIICKKRGWLSDKNFLPSEIQVKRNSIKTAEDAQKVIENNSISSKSQLEKHMKWLFTLCNERGWMSRIEFPNARPKKDNETINTVEEFQNFIDIKSINSRNDFNIKEPALYAKARRKKVLDKLVFPNDKIKKDGRWGYIRTVEDANEFIKKNGIKSWMDCRRKFSGFFSWCQKLRLCYDPKFTLKREKIYWIEFIHTIEEAQKFINSNEVQSPVDLEDRFPGFYGLCLNNGWSKDLVYPNKYTSLGETHITRYIDNNLKSSSEFINLLSFSRRFADLNNEFSYVCPDFLFQYKGTIYWIEYNGKQHYEYNSHFHECIDDFERQLRRDQAIRDFCSNCEYNLSLIEIPYIFDTYEKVEELLNNLINDQSALMYYELESINKKLYKI